ncbi:MAG: hypothetical protein QG670_549 [Thermoproteota archaeon]|nr:hypothetical protein [Thermoproteota archaeon]
MSTQKVLVGRRTLILLYALVALLAVSTVFYPIYYNYLSAQTNNNPEFNNLNDYLNNYVSTHTYNNSEYDNLKDIVDLRKNKIMINNLTVIRAAEDYHIEIFPIQYAGFILVNLTASTTDQNFIEVSYSSQWFYHEDYVIIVGNRGISMFPVLPSNAVQVKVGTPNSSTGGNQTFTIIYYY